MTSQDFFDSVDKWACEVAMQEYGLPDARIVLGYSCSMG